MHTHAYTLSPNFQKHDAFLQNIKTHFNASNESIHRARNELKVLHVNEIDEALVVKSFKIPRGIQKYFYSFLRPSKAKTSYKNACILQESGIETPSPVGYIEFFEKGILKESFYVSVEWKYDFTIREPLLNKTFPNREALFKAFAQFVYALHEAHITHKDLSPGNILIQKEGLKCCVVDINRMGFQPLSMKQRAQNFAKLWASDEDLTLMLGHYATIASLDVATFVKEGLKASHAHKAKINFKKRLRGVNVVD
ncbi:lipopolysaccharide kinase InaA family protein [Sulfurospirillum barnesii]|uniref:Serine/threonine protein kinase involved in cell cycle control n=1 Tax=Sulfurospirillum barnesii (strain ATCC 700032 / DSM 10660 / SES-3) TaxID=760154 RepID=I3XYZ3_SULBS|nr:lipopolysaccharide kinase InaA family protein [Sulfurospirillum barnesii]AFL69167.1 serine/threonine protein kinase involved in cell cycle control [Sulfurospirillum barnesii SES-3]